MEKSNISFWLQLILAAIIFETGSCIECYHCSSKTEETCGDPVYTRELNTILCEDNTVDETHASLSKVITQYSTQYNGPPPSGTSKSCVKIDARDMSNSKEEKITIRGCLYSRNGKSDGCQDISGKVLEGLMFCETCNEDGCNGSTKLGQASIWLSILMPCLALILIGRP